MAGKSDVRKLSSGPKLSEQAYVSLREGITAGRFLPGMKLTERSLAAELGVSATPVREALLRLEHERLVERDTIRSIRVADPSIARLHELSLIEAALRGVAAGLAATRASNAERTELIRMCDRADALFNAPDLDKHAAEMLKLTRRFHALVDTASHSENLIDMIATATAFDWSFRLKWTAQVHRGVASVQRSLDEHREVAVAVQRGDGETAETMMRAHILQRSTAYLDAVAHEVAPASERTVGS